MERAGWHGIEQIYREFPLRAGRVVVRGRTAQRDKNTVLRADYALFHKANIPLAVVEAKDNGHAMGAGMAQAISYATLLDVPFSFSSNGDGFDTFAKSPLDIKMGATNIINHYYYSIPGGPQTCGFYYTAITCSFR